MSKVYVLSGAYNDCDNDGVCVIAVSDNLDVIKQKMKEITETKGKEYLENTFGELTEEVQERYYEIRDRDGAWASFFITENELEGKPKTNGDRIRRMTDEELAYMLHNNGSYAEDEEPILDIWISEEHIELTDSFGHIKEWLAKEVE